MKFSILGSNEIFYRILDIGYCQRSNFDGEKKTFKISALGRELSFFLDLAEFLQ